jgi:hypothetical protein
MKASPFAASRKLRSRSAIENLPGVIVILGWPAPGQCLRVVGPAKEAGSEREHQGDRSRGKYAATHVTSRRLANAELEAVIEHYMDRRSAARIGDDPALRGAIADIRGAGYEPAEAQAIPPRPLPWIEHRTKHPFAVYGARSQHVRPGAEASVTLPSVGAVVL